MYKKKFDYPLGHPDIYVGDKCNGFHVKFVFGLVKCKVLPQRFAFSCFT